MSPMPPIPPPGAPWLWPLSFLGSSAIMASVVISRPATDAGILQCATDNLGRVDDALADQIAVLVGLGIVAIGVLGILEDLADDDRAIFTGVGEDLASPASEESALRTMVNADLLVFVLSLDAHRAP